MTRRARKLFEPKPFDVGAAVTWTHFTNYGPVEVEGVVVCGAPNVAGNRTMWVQPTTPGFTEVYSLVPVVRVGRDRFYFSRVCGDPYISAGSGRKGDLISSGVLNTDTCQMMRAAWQHGQQVKTAAAERFFDEHVVVIHIPERTAA